MNTKEKIIVAMSGGVDSAVTAGLLIEQGYEVIGINLRTWEYEAPSCDTTKKSCCSPEDIRDARDVGLAFNIPFYVFKMEKIFGEKVIDRFIHDYENGLTPNPCVECNTFVKFGSLFEKAKLLGIEKIATGHYAKVHLTDDGRYAVQNGSDIKKNQSYYLYGLSQDNLKNTLFPLGNMEKKVVREHAHRFGLTVADKKESQEICFIPENDYRKFLKKKNINFTPGFFKLRSGAIVGKHSGKENFTIGQRKGLGIAWKEPLYVLSIQDDGTVLLGEETETFVESFKVKDLTYQGIVPLKENEELECRVQIRYRHTPVKCLIRLKNSELIIKLLENATSVAPGQSAVFFPLNNDYVLLGGIIEKNSIIHKKYSIEKVLEHI